jgi:ribose transport system ATP-binding protein
MTTGVAESPLALRVRGLSKTFGGVQALRSVSLDVRSGEIHGLVGENGSGKSTLIKILAGFHAPDEPVIVSINGTDTTLPLHAGEAHRLGMRFVHQDLGLIPQLTVLENLLIEEFASANVWWISRRAKRRKATAMLKELDLSLDVDAPVENLRPTERALLAIARAVTHIRSMNVHNGGGLLVLDESTVYLPEHERQRLYDVMRSVALKSVGIIFVSHDVDEVLAVTDRVTVIRDGAVVGTVDSASATVDGIIQTILGRKLEALTRHSESHAESDAAVRIEQLAGEAAQSMSFVVLRGEIVGLTGLPGAGYDDVPYLLFGAARSTAGTLSVNGHTTALPSLDPAEALRLGIVLIPADRPRAGAVGSLTVAENVSLPVLTRLKLGPILSPRRVYRNAADVAKRFDVRPRDPRLMYSSLSGGNQQKVLLAKWLQLRPTLLLLHEPTQGVDIGARAEVFLLLRQAAAEGAAIIVASSDHEQLAAICDRVLVVRSGRIFAELRGEVGKEAIADACYAAAGIAGEESEQKSGRR